jgi:hypothetical protein
VIKRAEEHPLLVDIMLNEHKEDELADLKRVTKEALLLRDNKAVALNLELEAMHHLSQEISQLQTQIEIFSHKNRFKAQSLDPLEDIKVDSNGQLQFEVYEMLHHVLQTLVIHSGLNWSKDPQLKEIMLAGSVFESKQKV